MVDAYGKSHDVTTEARVLACINGGYQGLGQIIGQPYIHAIASNLVMKQPKHANVQTWFPHISRWRRDQRPRWRLAIAETDDFVTERRIESETSMMMGSNFLYDTVACQPDLQSAHHWSTATDQEGMFKIQWIRDQRYVTWCVQPSGQVVQMELPMY